MPGRRRRRCCSRTCPAIPKGMRLISGATNSSKRLAITLGLPVPSCPLDVVKSYRERMKEHRPIPPKTVRTGAVFENVDRDDEVDLLEIPGAVPAREGRRPLHGHRRPRDHARPRRRLDQRRDLSRHGARQEPRLDLHLTRQAGTANPRQILRGRQALPGADLLRARSAAVPRRRQRAALRPVGIRLRRRPSRRALRGGAERNPRPADAGACRDRARRRDDRGARRPRKARSASSPATTPRRRARSR